MGFSVIQARRWQVGKLQRVQFGGDSRPPQRYRLRRPPLQSAQYPSGAGTATMDGHVVNHWVYQRYDSDWKGYFPLLTAQKKQARQSREHDDQIDANNHPYLRRVLR